MLVIYRITETATALRTLLFFSRLGINWRYSPSMWGMDTPFVSARRILPCLVSWQNLKVIKVFVHIVRAKMKYNTRTTGTMEYELTNRPESGAKNIATSPPIFTQV